MKALVVDDSRAMRLLIGRILREAGFEVAEAGHGREAIDRLTSSSDTDLVLVDWNMPEMDGIEFVRTVRANRAFDGLRVMMVTTECDMEKVIDALHAGADDYVMKPFTRDVLMEKLSLLGVGA